VISIYMPAYNTSKLLRATVARIPAAAWEQIYCLHIINDGSSDDTAAIGDALALAYSKIRIHHNSQNCGYGAVVREGIRKCLDDGTDLILCLHADGQYAPEVLPRMLETMEGYNLDLLQGSRLAQRGALAGGMPVYKWAAGYLLCMLENRVFHLRMTDYHSGYLLYRRRFLEASGFEHFSGNFEIDLELIAAAKARGFLVGEVPIPTRYAGEVSHLNPVAYGLRVLGVLGRYLRGYYGRPKLHA